MRGALWLLALLALSAACDALYLPGVAPLDFARDDLVYFKARFPGSFTTCYAPAHATGQVNSLVSAKSALPIEYYSLPFCRPAKIVSSAENLGEVLRGDRIYNSLYQIQVRLDEECKVQCKMKLTSRQARDFRERIDDEYRVALILDNLPTAEVRWHESGGAQVKTYQRGYPVGYKGEDESTYYLNNHARFTILYNLDEKTDLSRIVGFEVEPTSVKHQYKNRWDPVNPQLETCSSQSHPLDGQEAEPQEVGEGEEVVFSYDVIFKQSDIRWASRWDTYLQMADGNRSIHWFSVVNSLMIVLFLSGMVAMIMIRTLRRDISEYNELDTAEEAAEESGWKLCHGDAFRPPPYAGALSVCAGTGVQLLGMASVTITFSMLGFLSPANRGGLMTAMLLLFVLMGTAAGYTSARLYKSFGLTRWRAMTLQTALAYPGFCFCIFFVLDLLIWGQRSSGAVPFGTLVALAALWFGISVPLVFVGSYFGFKRPALEAPVRTNKIPRLVPPQPWYMAPAFSVLVGGMLPFGAVFIELFFILTSLWLHQVYYIFGVLFLVYLILIVTCAEITIVLCYFQLASEDYRWWWRSFCTSGSAALYMFIYSAFYFATKLEITKTVSTLMYFGYMLILSVSFFLLTGTVGFLSCLMFVHIIYGSVKID